MDDSQELLQQVLGALIDPALDLRRGHFLVRCCCVGILPNHVAKLDPRRFHSRIHLLNSLLGDKLFKVAHNAARRNLTTTLLWPRPEQEQTPYIQLKRRDKNGTQLEVNGTGCDSRRRWQQTSISQASIGCGGVKASWDGMFAALFLTAS